MEAADWSVHSHESDLIGGHSTGATTTPPLSEQTSNPQPSEPSLPPTKEDSKLTKDSLKPSASASRAPLVLVKPALGQHHYKRYITFK